jgi:hypothetical protein
MASNCRLWPLAVAGLVALGCSQHQSGTLGPSGSRVAATEIKGVDADGKELALSDYRGKVVLVDFWQDH